MMITKRPTDEEAVAGGHDVPVPRVRVSVHESLLPGELSSLIGRSQLLRQGADTVGSARVLTFIGPGGVGKTRVAERLVHEMSRSSDFECGRVHLADLREGEDRLAPAIAQAFGLRENSPEPAEDLLVEHLTSRQAVLLLDNCEHLVGEKPGSGSVPQLLRTLLQAAPGLRVIATSQIRLGLSGEHLLPVPPLCIGAEESSDPASLTTVHEALQLLVVRARAVGVEIAESDYPVANRLCQLLDGLPLAIELAASQLDVLSLRSVVEHSDLLGLLVDGTSTEAHHRGLRVMLELSQKLLTSDEQRMWALMTVFESETGFDLDAARAVCVSDGIASADVQPLLSQLVRKSLLLVDHQAGCTRYRMLRVIRQFGQQLLTQAQQDADGGTAPRPASAVVHAAAEHFSNLARRGAELWLGPGEVEWMHSLRLELPNLRAAQKHFLAQPGQRRRGVELATNVTQTRCQIFAGKLNDSRRMLMLGLQHGAEDPEPSNVAATSMLAWIAMLQGRLDLAAPLLQKAERDAAALGLSETLAPLLYASATAVFLGEPDLKNAQAALPAMERAEAAFQLDGNAGDTFMAILFRAMAVAFLGERDQAMLQRDRLLALANEAQAVWSISWATWTSALVEFMHGSPRRSISLAQDALRLQREIGDTWGPTWSAWLLAVATAKVGDHELAGKLFGAVSSLQRESQTCVVNMQPFLRVNDEIRNYCRRTIGEGRFSEAITTGEKLSIEDGIALALTPIEEMHSVRAGENLLTSKEIEVIRILAQGKRYAEIGRDLDIADRTVETHVRNAKRKLDLHTRSDLVAWYLDPGSNKSI